MDANGHEQRIRELEGLVASLRKENADLRHRLHAESPHASPWRGELDPFQEFLRRTQMIQYRFDVLQDQYVYMSPVAEHVFGIPLERIKAMSFKEVEESIHPEDRAQLQQQLAEACRKPAQGRVSTVLEYRRLNGKGTYSWIRDWSTLDFDAQGVLTRVEGEARDVTEEHRMADAMHQLNHYWQAVLNHPRLAVGITDGQGTLLEWNATAEMISGWSREEVLGNDKVWDWCFPDPESRKLARDTVQSVLAGDRDQEEIILDAITRQGRTRTLFIFPAVYKNTCGESKRLILLALDITEQRKAEELLLKRNAQLSGILEHSPSCIHLLNPSGRFLLVNQRFESLHGVAREFLEAKLPAEVLGAENVAAFVTGDEEVLRHGRTVPWEATLTLEGKARVFQGVKFPLYDTDGEQLGLCAITDDVTERKQLQAETMRAGQLASLGELAAGVAHEINNPITGMINYAQILLDTPAEQREESEHAEICTRIIKEGKRIADIVRNLLSFARESDRERGPFPLRPALESALNLTRSQLKKDGITVNVDLEPDLPLLWGREREMQQVVLNLVSNSRYALNQRGGGNKRLDISARTLQGAKGRMVRLVVADNGPGIPEAIQERACDPFFSTKPDGEGTGLGLSITYGIIRDHGGSLSFVSREGEGARVVVELPAADLTAGEDPS